MRRLLGVLLAGLLAALVLAGCSASGGDGTGVDPNKAPDDVRLIKPTSAFTAKTLSDWKSLGDAIAVVSITRSWEDDSVVADNEVGVFGRKVTVAVLNTLWKRDAAHTPPSSFDMTAWGWVQRGNAKQAIVAAGEPRLETGHEYLLVLARFATGWSTLGNGAEVPFDSNTIGYGEWAGRLNDADQPAIADLMGKDLNQVQAIIDAAQPDPRSVQYGDLDPLARAKKLGKTSG